MTWLDLSRPKRSPESRLRQHRGFFVKQFLQPVTAPSLQDYIELSPVANIEALTCVLCIVYFWHKKVEILEHNLGILGKNESIIGRIYEHKGIA